MQPIYPLRPFERGIQETLGKYNRFVKPGLGFHVEITVDGIMWVRPPADIVITEHGISPMLLGSLPVTMTDVAKNGRQVNVLP